MIRQGLCLLGLAVAMSAQDAPKAPVAQGGAPVRQIVSVPDDVKAISEKSLTSDSSLNRDTSSTAPYLGYQFGGRDASGGVVPGANSDRRIGDNEAEGARATRFYGFVLRPSEEIQVKLACEDQDKITMQWVTGLKITTMTHQLRRANMAPRPLRCTRIAVKNVLTEPTEVVLALTGAPNYAYTMTIERKLN